MIIKRSGKYSSFTIIPNSIINSKNLLWRDVSLLIYLLSKPQNWDINVKHLATKHSSSIGAVYASLKRISDAGYCCYIRKNGYVEWFIFDKKIKDYDAVIKSHFAKKKLKT